MEFLEDHDPTLRLSCRSWLQQNTYSYDRILDPIIEEFIKYSNFIFKYNEQDSDFQANEPQITLEINGEFQTDYIIQNFGQLRNIILNSQDEIVHYIIAKNCSQHVQDQFTKKYEIYNAASQLNYTNNSQAGDSNTHFRPNESSQKSSPPTKSQMQILKNQQKMFSEVSFDPVTKA